MFTQMNLAWDRSSALRAPYPTRHGIGGGRVLPACVGGCRLAPVSSPTAVAVSDGDVKQSAARRSNSHQWVRSLAHTHGALLSAQTGCSA
jgi:hypothetical protein